MSRRKKNKNISADTEYILTPKGEQLAEEMASKNTDVVLESERLKGELKSVNKKIAQIESEQEVASGEITPAEMTYAQAKKIRKQKFTDMLAGKIVAGGGIGESLRATLSERTKAKVKGIKEAFDPMNMARFMGGNLGAAVYGRLRGRSQEDMEHFTGKKAKASQIDSTATKIDKIDVTRRGNIVLWTGDEGASVRFYNPLDVVVVE